MKALRDFQKILFRDNKTNPAFEFINTLPLAVLLLKVVGKEFIIANASDSYCELTSTSRDFLIGKQVPEAFPNESPSSYQKIKNSFHKTISSGKPDLMEILRYDLVDPGSGISQEKYWAIQNLVTKDNRNDTIYIWNFVIDMTSEVLNERIKRELETEKDKAKAQNRFFIEENPDGLYSLDRNGNFLSLNEGLLAITETSEEDLLKMDFLPFCANHDRERIVSYFSKAINGEPQNFDGDFVSAKGREMVINIDLLPMRINGQIFGAYGIAKDITSLRTSEKNLHQKKEFLDLYARAVDIMVAQGVKTNTLEFILGEICQTSDADQIYYLGESLRDNDGNVLIEENIQWSRKSSKSSILYNLSWYAQLQETFGPFQYDTPKIFELNNSHTQEQKLFFKENDMESLLTLPVFIKNEMLGIIGIENRDKKRFWQLEEKEFLRSLLKSVISFVEKKVSDLRVEKTEEELLRTESKFELMVQEGSDLIGILEADGTYKFVSASSSKILGISPSEFIGRNAFDFIHPEDKDLVFAHFSSITSQKQIHIPPFRFRDKNDNWRWVETTATNLLDVPQIEGIITNSRDVTREMERTREIKELNERYRLAAKATQDLLYDWDLATDEVTRFIEGKELMFGYPIEKMKDRNFWKEQIHPEDRDIWIKEIKTALNNPNTNKMNSQYRFQRLDGSYANIIDRGHIIRDEKGKAVRLIGATSDISEIISSKDAVKLANIRFNYAMKASREMIWDWNIKDDIILRSKAFKKLHGYNEDQATVDNLWFEKIVLKDREKVKDSIYRALEDPKISKWKKEYRISRLNGEKAYVIDRGFIIRDLKGTAIRMVGASLDVSESRRMIKEIKKQNKILKDIAWEQAHVVRGPLTRLKGLIELLKLEVFDEWSRDELISLIDNSADELDDIVVKIIRKTEEI